MQNMTGKSPSETEPGTILIFFNTDRECQIQTLYNNILANNNDHLWCDRTGLPKEFERLEKAEIQKGVEKVNLLAKHRY